MSLFKVNTFWSSVPISEKEENFDFNAFCAIKSLSKAASILVTGSYQGVLRVYSPTYVRESEKDEMESDGSKGQDLLLEMLLPDPILQIGTGRFVAGLEQSFLAILHPRRLSIYALSRSDETIAIVSTVDNGAVESKPITLILQYEHKLARNAANFTFGSFGDVKGRDFICVQSMDGLLSFFEQENSAFARFLPGFLIPGPIQYFAHIDSFLTGSSRGYLESYKYQSLAAASSEQRGEMQIQGGKKLRADWELNIGDNLLSIHPVQYETCTPSVLILCERSIVCVSLSAKTRFMRKLDYHPSCLHLYGAVGDKIRYVVSSYDGYLFVYQDGTLQWAAQLDHTPIAISVVNLQNLKGVIASLSDTGKLACSYLGTEPPRQSVSEQESRPVDYEAISREMRLLQKEIASIESGDVETNLNVQEMEVSVVVDDEVRKEDMNGEADQSLTVVTAHVTITNLVKSPLRNIALSLIIIAPLFAQPPFTQLEELEAQGKSTRDVSIILNQNLLPSSRHFSISISYTSMSGTPKYISESIPLPFALFLEACKPSKDGKHKITLETNLANAPLLELFDDIIGSDDTLPPNAIGFKLFSNSQPTLTIVVSKSSNRYRLQTDCIEVMWLFVEVLKERLELFTAKSDVPNKTHELSYNEELPLQDYFIAIDTHFEARINQLQLREILSDYAKQFRCIQKRILTRLKDKTPSPLNNLDVLLDGTYRQLLAIGNAEEQAAFKRSTSANVLSCITRLMHNLLEISHGLTPEESGVISQSLSSDIEESGDIGWEEKTDISITYLLKTCLSRSSKDASVSFPALEIPRDTSKLKKHISLMCDRLAKGCKPQVIKLPEFNTPFSKKLEADTATTE